MNEGGMVLHFALCSVVWTGVSVSPLPRIPAERHRGGCHAAPRAASGTHVAIPGARAFCQRNIVPNRAVPDGVAAVRPFLISFSRFLCFVVPWVPQVLLQWHVAVGAVGEPGGGV